MPLVDLKTNLKDLKFGHDAPHGGSSKQPYVTTPIPATDEPVPNGLLNSETGGPDFLIRGGLLLPDSVVHDEIRLGKFFLGTNGILFTIKQNVLSRIGVKAQGTSNFLNERLYTPISTLLAAGLSPLGIFPNKQGLNPFDSTFYADAIAKEINNDKNISNIFENIKKSGGTISLGGSSNTIKFNNRLTSLYAVKIIDNASIANYKANYISYEQDDEKGNADIIAYGGGPNSFLGIGKTHLRFATDNTNSPLRTGFNNKLFNSDPNFFFGPKKLLDSIEYLTKEGKYNPIPIYFAGKMSRFIRASKEYGTGFYNDDGEVTNKLIDNSLANVISLNTFNAVDENNNNTEVYSKDSIRDISETANGEKNSFLNGRNILTGTFVRDFRTKLKNQTRAPYYGSYSIEEEGAHLGDPGNAQLKNIKSYVSGGGGGAASKTSFDRINASTIYNSAAGQSTGTELKDLIQFRIGVIDNDTKPDDPVKKTYIHFRAFLDSISDNYTSNWDATKYIGRGENFYTYSGFDRKVSLSWTVVAQSKIELIPMYKRLNYLASICMPDYSGAGYMRGNIVTLTIGGYFYEQPGIITGFNYEMNEDNDTWEIGIGDKFLESKPDDSVKELPHIIRVKSFSFIPIHEFAPRKQQINFDPTTKFATAYGPERYIALKSITNDESNYGTPYYAPATTTEAPLPATAENTSTTITTSPPTEEIIANEAPTGVVGQRTTYAPASSATETPGTQLDKKRQLFDNTAPGSKAEKATKFDSTTNKRNIDQFFSTK